MNDFPFDVRSLNPETLEEALKPLSDYFIPLRRIRIQKLTIGKGAFGIVKLADLRSGAWLQVREKPTAVAVKILQTESLGGLELRVAFRLAREMTVWASCKHANILEFTGYHLSKDFKTAYLLSPFMRKGNMNDYLAREAPSLEQRLHFVLGTASGLDYLHSRDPPIVHGDLKPMNVLVSDNDDALLSDFGLARAMVDRPTGLSTSYGLKGTIRYCSPEIFKGGLREWPSDIWGWGCLSLEIITGRYPYYDCTHDAQVVGLICGPEGLRKTPEPSDAGAIPVPVLQLLRTCWSFDSGERPDSSRCVDVMKPFVHPAYSTHGGSGKGGLALLRNTDRNGIGSGRPKPPLDDALHRSVPRAMSQTVVGDFNPPEISGLPASANPEREFLLEIQGLSSASGKLSKRLHALNRTGQLTERTKPWFQGIFSDVSRSKLGDRVVAVKALRITNIGSLEESRMWKQLAREICVCAALDHPNVLELLGFAFEDGKPCLISPWCENGTLKEYLEKFPDANRRRLVREIAEGLRYLHEQTPPIIHGDFKTTNVFVSSDHVAKINDFRSTRLFGQLWTGFTTSGSVPTTTRYNAPEILQDGVDPTLSSDVFSFAYVVLEAMTDKWPFWKIRNDGGIFNAVVLKKQTPSPEDHPGMEEVIWELLRRCWNYEPSDRPRMIDVCKMLSAAGYRYATGFHQPPRGPSV